MGGGMTYGANHEHGQADGIHQRALLVDQLPFFAILQTLAEDPADSTTHDDRKRQLEKQSFEQVLFRGFFCGGGREDRERQEEIRRSGAIVDSGFGEEEVAHVGRDVAFAEGAFYDA